ncbi:MAG: hypothetical protein M0C28_32965 [Candidatus Moduliflexus flocculans]|nr:hypothetical protein [Candidatus Moduliflexus flocculans]
MVALAAFRRRASGRRRRSVDASEIEVVADEPGGQAPADRAARTEIWCGWAVDQARGCRWMSPWARILPWWMRTISRGQGLDLGQDVARDEDGPPLACRSP